MVKEVKEGVVERERVRVKRREKGKEEVKEKGARGLIDGDENCHFGNTVFPCSR
jgi:hypothetical protein